MALALGYKSPSRMLADLSASEYDEWITYFGMEPYPTLQTDIHFAHLTATLASANGAKNVKANDLLLQYKRKVKTEEEIADMLKSLTPPTPKPCG